MGSPHEHSLVSHGPLCCAVDLVPRVYVACSVCSGLDLYNSKSKTKAQRLALVAREYWKSSFARQLRVGLAFGIGGVGNKLLHRFLRVTIGLPP